MKIKPFIQKQIMQKNITKNHLTLWKAMNLNIFVQIF